MIKLSDEYKNNITAMFGQIGKDWLNKTPIILDKYIGQFGLTNIMVLDKLTYNIIVFADSNKYGPVILKVEIPFKELTIRETVALKLNNGNGACKCYYNNIEDGVLLLERLSPGKSLNEIYFLEDKIKIFIDVAKRFNIQLDKNYELPTYRDILNRSINMAMENKEKFSPVTPLLNKVDLLYKKIEEKRDSNYLLHSDLYSDNILLSNGEWKAIDPHGFVGNRIFDYAIFIQKELEKANFEINDVINILRLFEKHSSYKNKELGEALFINYVLNICWSIEINAESNYIKQCVNNSYSILNFIETGAIEYNKFKNKHL